MVMFSKNGGWIWEFIGFDGIGWVFSNFTMVFDTQITIVFMGFINQPITVGGGTLEVDEQQECRALSSYVRPM